MTIKNNHLHDSFCVNKNVTKRKHLSTNLLTVLTAKNSSLSTNNPLETRANTGFSACVDGVDAVDSCKATSLSFLFKPTAEAYPS